MLAKFGGIRVELIKKFDDKILDEALAEISNERMEALRLLIGSPLWNNHLIDKASTFAENENLPAQHPKSHTPKIT